ncbi:fused MFS/spermidine synthase [Flavobacterium sp. CYK-55]|uniref:spermidine synthase n=1 Tax=Flavobacterium sp. CYK-55 TaxID=2835529 RepID=UPI001BCF03AC|nr:fused MFS/spermidine synthase [Flavobacterium sp. CYK-55]MBS7786630.1 fused MFS/spermidine synthase [Flavobacterium sp. CYK-55]
MLKRLLSYIVPIRIHQKKSSVSKNLEVTWANGQLVLDSKNTNYSYGSLQRVLRKGLKKIGFDNIRNMQEVLILGVAGGSVIKTLTDEIKCTGKITGVEIDPEVIALANEYFDLNQIPNLKIVIDDAFDYVLRTPFKYDLIVVDIFQDTAMPNFLFEKFFMTRLGSLLKRDGYILFNTMILNKNDNARNDQYHAQFNDKPFRVTRLPRVESHNELILIHRYQ